MRQIINLETTKISKGINLDENMIMYLGSMYNKPDMVHIESLYFTADGKYWHNAYMYQGSIKEFKNKLYAKMPNVKHMVTIGGDKKIRYVPTPESQYEIVKTVMVEDIIKDYIKLLNKNK